MAEIRTQEGLMIAIINRLAEAFGAKAILKGGMALRLLDCPRHTNDLDYIFVPFHSKKDIVKTITQALEEIPGTQVEVRLHSTNANFLVRYNGPNGTVRTQVEVSVAAACPTQPMSTAQAALSHGLAPHIISVMRLDVALAHKLAAWNERNLVRDLYDAAFLFQNLGVLPDRATLLKRLKRVNYAKPQPKGPRRMTLEEFLEKLEAGIKNLNEKSVRRELGDYLPPAQLAGLRERLMVALNALLQDMREAPDPPWGAKR